MKNKIFYLFCIQLIYFINIGCSQTPFSNKIWKIDLSTSNEFNYNDKVLRYMTYRFNKNKLKDFYLILKSVQ